MSYTFNKKCFLCTKKDKCIDFDIIGGAIIAIHSIYPASKGHLGSGSVDLNCDNYVQKGGD